MPNEAVWPLCGRLNAITATAGAHDPLTPRPDQGGAYAARADRQRLIAATEALHRLGPRVLAEFLLEAASDEIPRLIQRLDEYARISPEVARALGCDDWTLPIRRSVRRGAA